MGRGAIGADEEGEVGADGEEGRGWKEGSTKFTPIHVGPRSNRAP